ncbi:MAG: isoamylase [Thiobacillus sp.]|nr:isoamylase [Thiobacillus sp.]
MMALSVIADRENDSGANMKLAESATSQWATKEGLSFPLGSTRIEQEGACNFALYSKHAESVTLLLYTKGDVVNPVFEYRFDYLKNKTGRVWHCRMPFGSMGGASYYAYSVDGPAPNGRFEWHGFDRDKILLDPYAKSVFFPPDFDRLTAVRPGSNAGKAPLGVLAGDSEGFDWQDDHRPQHEADTVIYELHVGAFTQNPNSGVKDEARGTFAGLVEKVPYLKDLGITVVELMPVFQYDPLDGNYWGYMPLNFFSPHHGYLSNRTVKAQHNEMREMIKTLHQADIEVVLDVVYNHTGEGDHNGPVYSYKGIDNSTYYLMTDRPEAPYENFSGTGNTLNTANRAVRKMIMDSARHWALEMHVDGFRFDLASLFTRKADGSVNAKDVPLLSDMASDPDLAHLRLIAEPWDAAGVYQLGRAFPGIKACQWNGKYRDDLRRFVKGDPGMVPALMRRLYGSDDLFPDDRMNAYHPHQSVNHIDSHDGFTLYDLVAYNEKRNGANGHNNSDGMAENHSWNCGWEGDEGAPPEVMKLRRQQIKNFCCLLLLSNGTPMFRAGDEFMHTQGGNNNPYNQDNETGWIDWDRLHANPDMFRFFKLMIAFRKAHPSLARSRFWREDVSWYGVGHDTDLADDSRSLAFALHGASQQDIDLYVMINACWEDLTFEIQEGAANVWRRVVDTSLESPSDILEPGYECPLQSMDYRVPGRTVVVLVRDGT